MFISASAKLALPARYSRRFCRSSRECFVRAAVHAQKEMTDETQMAAAPPRDNRREVRAITFGVAGWMVPGLGHALQKMWGRAITFFAVVGVLVFVGAGMRGNLFNSVGGADVSHAYGDYGTRFLAAAGVLNLLAALHAYEAARGRKA